MTSAKTKFFLPVGISALALIALQGPALAQDVAAPAMRTDTAIGQEVSAERIDTGNGAGDTVSDAAIGDEQELSVFEQRSLPDSLDPLARDELERLDRLGIVGAQARIGEDILIIDRQIRRAEAIQTLIGYLGADGFRLHYPQLAAELRDSPLMLQAALDRAKLLADIREANSDAAPAEEAPRSRDDGSSFFNQANLQTPPANAGGRPAPLNGNGVDPAIAAMISEQIAALAPPASTLQAAEPVAALQPALAPISLREVYGVSGDLHAIIVHGDERIRVGVGDVLPNDTTILTIEADAIVIRRRGVETRVQISG